MGISIILIGAVPRFIDTHQIFFFILSLNNEVSAGWSTAPLQMYTAGHVYVFVSTKGSLWCWNSSGPWREKKELICQPRISLFFFLLSSLEVLSWLFLCTLEFSESCFAEERQQQSLGSAIISSKGIINQADMTRMVWHKSNILCPAACARLRWSFPQFRLYSLSVCHWLEF